jgi:hypothetical protein
MLTMIALLNPVLETADHVAARWLTPARYVRLRGHLHTDWSFPTETLEMTASRPSVTAAERMSPVALRLIHSGPLSSLCRIPTLTVGRANEADSIMPLLELPTMRSTC